MNSLRSKVENETNENFNNIAPRPMHRKLVIGLSVSLAVLSIILFYTFDIRPARSEISRIKAGIEKRNAAQSLLTEIGSEQDQVKSANDKLDEKSKSYETLLKVSLPQ